MDSYYPQHAQLDQAHDNLRHEVATLRETLKATRSIYLMEIERLEWIACGAAFAHGMHSEELLRRLREAA